MSQRIKELRIRLILCYNGARELNFISLHIFYYLFLWIDYIYVFVQIAPALSSTYWKTWEIQSKDNRMYYSVFHLKIQITGKTDFFNSVPKIFGEHSDSITLESGLIICGRGGTFVVELLGISSGNNVDEIEWTGQFHQPVRLMDKYYHRYWFINLSTLFGYFKKYPKIFLLDFFNWF